MPLQGSSCDMHLEWCQLSILTHWPLCGCLLCAALSEYHQFVGHLLWFSNIEACLLPTQLTPPITSQHKSCRGSQANAELGHTLLLWQAAHPVGKKAHVITKGTVFWALNIWLFFGCKFKGNCQSNGWGRCVSNTGHEVITKPQPALGAVTTVCVSLLLLGTTAVLYVRAAVGLADSLVGLMQHLAGCIKLLSSSAEQVALLSQGVWLHHVLCAPNHGCQQAQPLTL